MSWWVSCIDIFVPDWLKQLSSKRGVVDEGVAVGLVRATHLWERVMRVDES